MMIVSWWLWPCSVARVAFALWYYSMDWKENTNPHTSYGLGVSDINKSAASWLRRLAGCKLI
jgi:hypothetical protein